LATKVTGDSNNRYQLLANGTMQWGPGNAAADTFMLRDSAAGTLAVQPVNSSSSATGTLRIYSTGTAGGVVELRQSNNTIASPTATASGNVLGTLAFDGYNGSAYATGSSIRGVASEAWTGSANGARLEFYTTTNGTTTLSERMRISNGGTVEIASTGTPGTVEKLRVNTPTTVDNAAATIFTTGATTSKGLVIQAVASQSANLQEWQNSSAQALSFIGSNGQLTLGSTAANVQGQIAFFDGTNAFTNTLKSSASASNKTITLPNENGTVCLQSSSSCGFAIGSGTAFLQGGNSFGTTASLGTIESQPLRLKTGNVEFFELSTSGVLSCVSGAVCGVSFPGAGSLSERFGLGATAGGAGAIAIGKSASAGFGSSIAIGAGAATTAANQVVIGGASNIVSSVFFGNGSCWR
ncbi:hypothetical protein HYX70_03815, partial [Candidatus Saccharibacteria bacterium]|nr:hypothetical protein [Candidatus Saccharibacteria bacterium]